MSSIPKFSEFPLPVRKMPGFESSSGGMFFEIGPSMKSIINDRLKVASTIQLFYLFAANHTFQFLEKHQDQFGRDIPTEEYVSMLTNINELRQSVFACFATLVYGSELDPYNPEHKQKLDKLYTEFDAVDPAEVFMFINYCRQWWDATRVVYGFTRSRTKLIYNVRRNYIGLYNPMMTHADKWWDAIHYQGSLQDHSTNSLAIAAVAALQLQAHIGDKHEMCELIESNEEGFIAKVDRALQRLIGHYCETGANKDYAVYDYFNLTDDEHSSYITVRFIAFNKMQTVSVQLAMDAVGIDLRLQRPSTDWVKNNAPKNNKPEQETA